MTSRTGIMQEHRYLVHAENFNGLHGNFLSLINELSRAVGYQMLQCKEGSRIWEIR